MDPTTPPPPYNATAKPRVAGSFSRRCEEGRASDIDNQTAQPPNERTSLLSTTPHREPTIFEHRTMGVVFVCCSIVWVVAFVTSHGFCTAWYMLILTPAFYYSLFYILDKYFRYIGLPGFVAALGSVVAAAAVGAVNGKLCGVDFPSWS